MSRPTRGVGTMLYLNGMVRAAPGYPQYNACLRAQRRRRAKIDGMS